MLVFLRRNAFQLVSVLVILALAFNRLFYGVELTDESFYYSTSYRYLQGNTPFYDAWDGAIGSSLLSLPFFALYRFIVGSTQGIVLFSRISFFCFMLFVGFTMYNSIKSVYGHHISSLAATVLIVFAPFSLYNWSYNNLSFALFITGLFLLACSLQTNTQKKEQTAQVLAGICFALMVFSYITHALTCLFVAILFFIVAWKSKKSLRKGLKAISFVTIGGFGIAVFLTIVLLMVTQGNLFKYLPNILNNKAIAVGGNSMAELILNTIKHTLRFIMQYWAAFAISVAGILVVQVLAKRNKYFCVITPFFFLIALFWFSSISPSYAVTDFVAFCGILWTLWIPFINKYSEKTRTLYWLLGIGGIFGFICVAGTSGGGAVQGKYMLFCLLLAVLMPILEDITQLPDTTGKHFLACIPALLLSGSLLFLWYSDIYREKPINQLTKKVEQGIYKGIYTTPERANMIENLEAELKNLQKSGGNVLFLGTSPYAYTMVDMKPTTPTTWRVAFYSDVYYDWFPVYYACGEDFKPDQIFFLEDETYQDFIKNPDLELSQILLRDYTFTMESIDNSGTYHIRLFVRNK